MTIFKANAINIKDYAQTLAADALTETKSLGWDYSVALEKFNGFTIMITTEVNYFGHRAVSSNQKINFS